MHVTAVPSLLPAFRAADARGVFSKPYSYDKDNAPFAIRELFWSSSAKGVVRGMHCQLPPAQAAKLIWVSHGTIADVAVDLRRGTTYGAVHEFILSAEEGSAVLIPVGFAHGFQALSEGAIVNYAQEHEYAPATDTGINWRTIDYTWPLEVSETSPRDESLPALDAFDSPWVSGTR
ncbi:dTDP-4-dehydrorhamnose 3,5-epimerase [Demequina sp.]|uniref:dTDP-4-dehydrorhamnose 3,5-epimerase n=1 Tax=Demequina sp. TaxID=2050685 RepID=UPI0025BE1117|nr:dTDP-4-dehydrorhamnose 3,5-epimerase [Demequina sp.]